MSQYNSIKLFFEKGYSVEEVNKKFPHIGKLLLYKYLKIYRLERFNQDAKNVLYHSAKWKELRRQVIARDGRKCHQCGSTKTLQLEHCIPKSLRPDLIADLTNLVLLCAKCHKSGSTFGRKGIRNTVKARAKLLKKISET